MDSLPVSSRHLKRFIKHLLKNADLTEVSSKMIRKQCEKKFRVDLTEEKKAVDKLIMACIRKAGDKESDDSSTELRSSSHGDSQNKAEDEEVIEVYYFPPCEDQFVKSSIPVKKRKLPEFKQPSPKKVAIEKPEKQEKQKSPLKQSDADISDDAALAQKLHDEEWNFRSRASRAVKKSPPKKKQSVKSANKPKTSKAKSSYSRKCVLSPALAAVMNETEMARHDVVKRMWQIARERNLFDPKNKQFILCDDQLLKVFGKKRVRMFGIMKHLKNHVKDVE